MSQKVLVVDDEQSIVTLLKYNLEQAGYIVEVAYDGEEALEKVNTSNPELVVLDIMLPKKDGIEVCKTIRSDKNLVPILMLTAKDDEFDRRSEERRVGKECRSLFSISSCISNIYIYSLLFFFFQAEDGIRDRNVTGVQTCALPISKKLGIFGLPKAQLPDLKEQMIRYGYMLLPVFIIVGTIMIGFTPQRAAILGILSAYLVSFIRKESRLSIKKTFMVLEQGTRVALPVIAAVATAGIIAGVVSITGLGGKFATGIIALSN